MDKLLEKAKKIKIIFFDIDDTLRLKDPAFMPESINEVFEKLREKGIMTGIATGRNLFGVVPEVRALKPDFYVAINGAYVENAQTEEVIFKNTFSKTLIAEIISWLETQKSEYSFVSSDSLRISKWTDVAAEAIGPIYAELAESPDYYKTHDVYQMLTVSDHDDQLVLPEHLKDKIRMVRWHPYSSDIVPQEGSKAIGCEKVLDLLGLTAENMMNFGDGLNDRELFDFAGLSVAMEVSHPEILEKADYVTDRVENDGILKALQFLKIID
ncbi:Cof-type HAD-IIB family hydrolase [Lactococcus kimchii]|uniref:Cof-type HAD-IIB family hydrolase n=1 Tax=Lactococcus sp. S-13 TaxID=2507158 RepID=UPI0010233450|nr:Cof-type HAD-IIB family hydrolase [Lactococcus sp. S-13]RZI48476.1 Cof-type HAD-IIB family hydrolase [Lactococcus sp. S-13]